MLELVNITFAVDEKIILQDVNLTMESDSFVVITGPNGSGKSTLAKLIMGIERPSSGRIMLDGRDITGLSVTERAQAGIAFAFQQPVRFKGLTVKDLISLSAGSDLSTEEACTYLSEVGLCARDYVDRDLDARLSGGELKRIEIAMVIARGTKISIFDEPEAGIDLWSFQNLIQVFENMRTTHHGSILIISHQERILEIADKLVVLSEGHVVKTGTKEEVLPELLADSVSCAFYRGDES